MSESKKSIRWGYLPDEILTQIFTFLPIKSIIICTCVSKTWKSLIKNPAFISTHLHHSHNKNQNLFLLSVSRNDKQVYTLHKEDGPDFTEYTSFDSPFHAPHLQHPHHRTYNDHGTCNGLICLSYSLPNHGKGIFLWNPCVRKFLQLPYPDVTVDTHGSTRTSFGFGFDPKTNDYKVVRILSILRSPSEFGKSRPEVDVYSLSTGEWRMLSASASLPPTCGILHREPPAFANGALHWIALSNDNKHFVLVFDLGDEVFRQIQLPELPSYTVRMMWTRVSVYGNSIAGFQRRVGSGPINIWVMKEYGVASSWTKFSYQCPSLGMLRPCPVGFRRNGEVVLEDNRIGEAVLLNDRRGLISWNPDSQNVKNLEINGSHKTFFGSYVESLVLLDKAAKGVVTKTENR